MCADEGGFYHESVMPTETLGYLNVQKDKLYLDGTLGGGGHSRLIMQGGGKIVAFDKDADAINHCKKLFETEGYEGKYTLIKDDFKNALARLSEHGITQIDGALLDLGISSHQIDEAERGFSYMKDGELDMRMDKAQTLSARIIVNDYSEQALADIIFKYGEERGARRIASEIVKVRRNGEIDSTLKLAQLIKTVLPFNPKAGHPAKKTFQALRIAVNGELNGLEKAVSDILSVLKNGSRLAVLTFHSLEDRIIKQAFKKLSTDCICSKQLPVCVCGHKAEARLIVNKGIKASIAEQQNNSRSKSATLRIIEKM